MACALWPRIPFWTVVASHATASAERLGRRLRAVYRGPLRARSAATQNSPSLLYLRCPASEHRGLEHCRVTNDRERGVRGTHQREHRDVIRDSAQFTILTQYRLSPVERPTWRPTIFSLTPSPLLPQPHAPKAAGHAGECLELGTRFRGMPRQLRNGQAGMCTSSCYTWTNIAL